MSDPNAPARPPATSLALRLVSVVLAATFLTALVVSWLAAASSYDTLRRRLEQSFPAQLARSADRLTRWLAAGQRDLESLAGDPTLRSVLDRSRAESAAWQRLAEALAESDYFESIVVVDASGEPR